MPGLVHVGDLGVDIHVPVAQAPVPLAYDHVGSAVLTVRVRRLLALLHEGNEFRHEDVALAVDREVLRLHVFGCRRGRSEGGATRMDELSSAQGTHCSRGRRPATAHPELVWAISPPARIVPDMPDGRVCRVAGECQGVPGGRSGIGWTGGERMHVGTIEESVIREGGGGWYEDAEESSGAAEHMVALVLGYEYARGERITRPRCQWFPRYPTRLSLAAWRTSPSDRFISRARVPLSASLRAGSTASRRQLDPYGQGPMDRRVPCPQLIPST